MTSKLSLSCTIVTVLSVIIIENILFGFVGSTSTAKQIIEDLPVETDLNKYLKSLEKIVYFANSNKHIVDLYVYVGLLFTDVNLRSTLQVREKRLQVQTRVHLENLLKANIEIKKYFLEKVDQFFLNLDPHNEPPVQLVNLLTNATTWPNHLRKFNVDLLEKTKSHTRKQLEAIYFKWPVYKDKLNSYYNYSAKDPGDSGVCWNLLARNRNNYMSTLIHCKVPYKCVTMAVNGTHFGKGMTDRIMFLIMTRFGRGCVLLSPSEDKDLLDSLCASAYNEIEFSAYHGFEATTLMMEIMSLCSLGGHAQFLQRSWIDEALDFQTNLGCFNLTRPATENMITTDSTTQSLDWKFVTSKVTIMGGSCNAQSTAVAAGMLSAAIRYILETFY